MAKFGKMLPISLQKRKKLKFDTQPRRAAGYALRKIVKEYTGNAIRVRRSSDNTEQDIGFNGQNLNISTLTSFVGGGNGFIVTIYDQSGNLRHLTQATQAAQPQIVSSGVVILRNNKPSILFDGVNDVLNATIPTLNAHTINVVTTPLNSGVELGILNYSTNTIDQSITVDGGNTTKCYFGSSLNFVSTASALNVQNVLTRKWNGVANINLSDLHRNGVGENVRTGTPSNASVSTTLSVGRALAFSQQDFQELSVFTVPLSIVERNRLENEQGNFYKITILP